MTEGKSSTMLVVFVVLVVVLSVVFTWKAMTLNGSLPEINLNLGAPSTSNGQTAVSASHAVTMGQARVGINIIPTTKGGA